MPYYNGRWHLYDERERREYGERKRQERSQDWHARWISKQGLKNRLWTDKAISSFLSKPKKAGKIMAWPRTEVLTAEKPRSLWHGWKNDGNGWMRAAGFRI